MNFSGDVSDGDEVVFKIDFSIDIREQISKKKESDSALSARIEKMKDETLRSELWLIAYNDSYIYNIVSEIISCEINDYAEANGLEFHEYENLTCEKKAYAFDVCGRKFEFAD